MDWSIPDIARVMRNAVNRKKKNAPGSRLRFVIKERRNDKSHYAVCDQTKDSEEWVVD
jgi:hypothetical protein